MVEANECDSKSPPFTNRVTTGRSSRKWPRIEHIAVVHAQDHFMTSLLAIDLITEMIELHSNQKGERK